LIAELVAALPWVSIGIACLSVASSVWLYRKVRAHELARKVADMERQIACMERFKGYAARVERGEALSASEVVDYTTATLLMHGDNPAEACHSLAVVGPFVFGPHRRHDPI